MQRFCAASSRNQILISILPMSWEYFCIFCFLNSASCVVGESSAEDKGSVRMLMLHFRGLTKLEVQTVCFWDSRVSNRVAMIVVTICVDALVRIAMEHRRVSQKRGSHLDLFNVYRGPYAGESSVWCRL